MKWTLLAAAFALSLGLYAEHVLSVEPEDQPAATIVKEAAPAPAPSVIAG